MDIIMKLLISLMFIFITACSSNNLGIYMSDKCQKPIIRESQKSKCKKVCKWKKSYMSRDRVNCMRIKYHCPQKAKMFGDNTGCGCAKPVFCDE